jgi:hypothetical protein
MKRKVPNAVEKAIDQQIQARAAAKTRKPSAKTTLGDEPKMTQAESIAQAFTTLRNAGLLPVSLEAKPTSNADNYAAHTHPSEQKQASGPGEVWVKEARGAVDLVIDNLQTQLVVGNEEITKLLNTLQPYLPRRLFEPQDDDKCSAEECEFEYQPTSGGSLSEVQIRLNSAANELNQLRRRIRQLTKWVVL